MSMVGSKVVSATEEVGDMGGWTLVLVLSELVAGDLRRSRLVGVTARSLLARLPESADASEALCWECSDDFPNSIIFRTHNVAAARAPKYLQLAGANSLKNGTTGVFFMVRGLPVISKLSFFNSGLIICCIKF